MRTLEGTASFTESAFDLTKKELAANGSALAICVGAVGTYEVLRIFVVPPDFFHTHRGWLLLTAFVGLAALAVCIYGWRLFLTLCTDISRMLPAPHSATFQIGVSLAVPALMAFYLASDVNLTLSGMTGHVLSLFMILKVAFLVWLGWTVADYVDWKVPLRTFVNTSMALFLLVILGRAGAFAGASDYDSSSYTYTQEDLDAERIARDTGVHFTMFVLFVTAMNSAFLAKLVKRRGLSAGMDKE